MTENNRSKKLLFLVSDYKYFCSHRLSLGIAAIKAGYQVALATRCNQDLHQIQKAGIQIFPLKHFSRAGINPIRQLKLLREIHAIYQEYKPDIVHQVAIKPVLLGSLIAYFCKVPRVINALGGLGYLFIPSKKQSLKKYVLHFLVCKALRIISTQKNTTLILQNRDDLNTLVKDVGIKPKHIEIIRGAGVNMAHYPKTSFKETPPIIIACVSRLLWDKGIGELILAIKLLKAQGIPIECFLYGMPDPENPSSIPEKQLKIWQDVGTIVWKGHCEDVAKAYQDCHIAVLASYREGLPKSLLEAASSARPIVTTDVPGCHEVVEHLENGLLVPPKDSIALAEAIHTLVQDPALRTRLGEAGRKRIAQYFSEEIVHEQTLSLYADPTFNHP